MTVAACAEIVERGDPDRFLATMTAPPADRARLWPLYAFNLEVARAPWASPEPMIGAMRLQFWTDTLESIAGSRGVAAHEVAGPLADLIAEAGLPVAPLLDLVAARQADLDRAAPADATALWAYLDATGGTLMAQAVRALGGDAAQAHVAAEVGAAAAMAAWLAAAPRLAARGRRPIPPGTDPTRLADRALARLAVARAAAPMPARLHPALRTGWRAKARLVQVRRRPDRVMAGGLEQSEFVRRGSLLWRTVTGRW